MSHVNWEYYSSLFSKVKEEDFKRAETLAEKEVRAVIGPVKWETITENTFGYQQLQDCICNVIDKMAEDEESGRGKGISSVSNDGYSESYSVTNPIDLRNELQSSIKAWLSGTGMVGAY